MERHAAAHIPAMGDAQPDGLLSLLIEEGATGIWSWDPVRGRIHLNPVAARILGTTRSTLTADEWFACVALGDRERLRRRLEGVRADAGERFELEFSIRRPDGLPTRVRVIGCPQRAGGNGSPDVRIVGILDDWTDQQQLNKALELRCRQLDERVKELQCLYRVSSTLHGSAATIEQALHAVVQNLGQGWQYPDIAYAELETPIGHFRTDNARETPWRQTVPICLDERRIGSLSVGYLEERPDADDGPFLQQEMELLRTVGRMIEEALLRRRYDENLRRLAHTQSLLDKTFDSLDEAVFVVDPRDGTILMCNAAVRTLFGWHEEELIGRLIHLLHIDEEHRRQFLRRVEPHLREHGSYQTEYVMRRRNGEHFPTEHCLTAIRDEQGRITEVVSVVRDLTERLHFEKQLRQAQKLEAVGQLAGGVALDFNNLLQVIDGFGHLLAEELEDGSPQREALDQMLAASERGARLVRQLMTFSRRAPIEPRVVNLNRLIDEMLKMLIRVIGEHIDVHTDLDKDLAQVLVDPGQFEQILMNLCVNARDAIGQNGEIIIRTRMVHDTTALQARYPDVRHPAYVQLQVCDNGMGIEPEHLELVFDPFFSTKGGKGTGLGLATVYGIVKRHEGFVEVQSEKGVGTTFSVYVPACVQQAEKPVDTCEGAACGDGQGRVLLAEDDELVRSLAVRILERAGYDVITARDGVEAIETFRREHNRIDVIIIDAIMPRLSGRVVFDEVRRLRPDLPVLFVSGYGPGFLDAGFLPEEQNDAVGIVHKPFRPEDLLRTVHELLMKTHASPSRGEDS